MAVAVNATELRDACDFVSSGDRFGNAAYISLDTGRIYWRSSEVEMEEDLPTDIEESDRYLAVPSQRELGLGRRLVMDFVSDVLPDEYEGVADFFRRRGAYARFKALLAERGKLEAWYAFEAQAADAALRDWCEDNGIEVTDNEATS